MKPEVTLKYLSYVANKKNKGQEGFTLIELLVVVIIIGVLAAVALPNLLGQIGKARETEAKNAIGTYSKTQQGYHLEKTDFADLTAAQLQASNILGTVIPPSKYYDFAPVVANAAGGDDTATLVANGITTAGTGNIDNGKDQGTRDYSGGIIFVQADAAYGQQTCQANVIGDAGAAPSAGDLESTITDPLGTCPTNMTPSK